MPVNLSSLAGTLAKTEVEFMGHKTPITYDPLALTAERINKMQKGSDEEFFAAFCEIIKAWDVKRGSTKVPINPKSLPGIPLPFLQAVFQQVNRDGGDGAAKQGKTSNGS